MAVTEKLRFLLEADATGVVRAFDKVGDAADKNLIRAQSRMDKVGAGLSKFGAASIGVGVVVGGALFKAASAFEDLAISAGKFSDATGVAVEDASRWIEVAGDMGIESGALESGLNKLNKTIGASPEKLEKFGVAVQRTATGAVDVNATFLALIDRLNEIPDPAKRAQVASELLGRGWQSMAELIGQGSAALKASLAEVGDAQVVTEDELAKAKAFRASMDELKDSMQSLVITVGQGAAPVIGTLAKVVGGAVDGFGRLNAVSDGLVGQVASIGATALIAGGGVAFLAGKAIQARAALARMSSTTLIATGVIAGAAVIYQQYASAKEFAEAQTRTFVQALQAEAAGQKDATAAALASILAHEDWQQLSKETGISTADLARVVRGEVVPAWDAWLKSMDAAGPGGRLVVGIMEDMRGRFAAARVEADLIASTTKELTGDVDLLGGALDSTAGSMQRGNHAAGEYAATLAGDVVNAQRAAARASGSLAEQELRAAQALRDYNAAWDALTGEIDENDAIIGLIEGFDSLREAHEATAEGAKAGAEEQKAAFLAEGRAINEQKRKVIEYGKEILKLPDDQVSTLLAMIDEGAYELVEMRLKALARNRTISLAIEAKGGVGYFARVNPGGGQVVAAAGGIVTRPTVALIGEAGPEAVVPLNRAPGASPLGAGGATFNITVHAGLGTDGRMVGQQIIEEIKRAENSIGTGWRN